MVENKLELTDAIGLARAEERLSKRKAIELWLSGELDRLQSGTVDTLARIHARLFEDIYGFADEIRSVNMSKGNFRFASALYLRAALETIERMPQSTFDEIINKYGEMNVAYPFREGNGRRLQLWLDHMLKCELRRVLDWSRVDKARYLLAMFRSPIDPESIKRLLSDALTDAIDAREIFLQGLDASYFYEDHIAYRSADLLRSLRRE